MAASKLMDRDEMIKSYEGSLGQMRRSATVVAFLHICTRFISLCAITWATFVLLAAFLHTLSALHLYLVCALLFMEAARFSTLAFFAHLITLHLSFYSSNPKFLTYTDISESKQKHLLSKLALGIRTLLILLSLSASIYGLLYAENDPTLPHNLPRSLALFYSFLLANSLLAAFCLAFEVVLWRFTSPASSVMLENYRAAVFEKALRVGLLDAQDLDFFAFAFRQLSKDYARNLQPLTVKKLHEELVKYLYAHRKGVEVVYEYLQSKDTFEQQAAANMVGFWAEERGIATEYQLLSRLATKIGIGQTGWAAANVFSLLAKLYPDTIAAVRDDNGRNLIQIILPLLDNNNSMSLVLLRLLISLLKQQDMVDNMEPVLLERLEERLRRIVWENRRQRTRTLGAYALKLLGKMSSEDKRIIGSIDPSKDAYFLEEEKGMLDQLYLFAGLSIYPNWHECEIRQFK